MDYCKEEFENSLLWIQFEIDLLIKKLKRKSVNQYPMDISSTCCLIDTVVKNKLSEGIVELREEVEKLQSESEHCDIASLRLKANNFQKRLSKISELMSEV